jgi:Mrp family chromosome partitioning ATPase/capsular polysaccharide biosynthesis protein
MVEPINYAGALRRSWRLLMALAIVGAIVAVLIPVGTTKHSATGKLHWETTAVVGSVSATGIGDPPVGPQAILFWADNFYTKAGAITAAGLLSSYSELAPLMSATTTALGKTGKSNTASTSAKSTKISPESVVELTTYGTSKAESAHLTNIYAKEVGDAVDKAYAAHLKNLSKAGQATAPTSSGFTVIEPALASSAVHTVVATSQLNSRKVRLLLGIVLGLVLAALIVLVRELLDKTVRDEPGAARSFRYPVLVSIPERSPLAVGDPSALPLDVVTDPMSTTAEAYRMLRMSVMFEGLAPTRTGNDGFGDVGSLLLPEPPPYRTPDPDSRRVVLVVSPGAEESRSVVAANLSAAYAESGQRAIVVSTADIDPGPRVRGLIEPSLPAGTADIAAHLQASSVERVSRLSLRPFVMNSGQLVTRAPEVFAAARQLADVIIVEAPPLLAVHHGEALAHAVDVALVVGECGTTTYDGARRSSDLLRRLGAPVLGVVLTGVRQSKREKTQGVANQAPPSTQA